VDGGEDEVVIERREGQADSGDVAA
jgi:hypothetical protein